MSLENFKKITPEELRKHCTEDDAWISIKGLVYDITKYLLFHPGGIQQIMQAVGMDGTRLFFDVHPSVNYDQILAKYIVGALTSSHISLNVPDTITRHNVAEVIHKQEQSLNEPSVVIDWVQRSGSVNFFFYTCSMSNPYLQILPLIEKLLQIYIIHSGYIFEIHFDLYNYLRWPPKFKVNAETGKIDIVFDKVLTEQWKGYGTSTIIVTKGNELGLVIYKNVSKKRITHDCFLIEFERVDGALHNMPIVHYLNLYGPDGVCRKYGGIPGCVAGSYSIERFTTSRLFIIVKRYNTGNVSKHLVRLRKNDIVTGSQPTTHIYFKAVTHFKQFMMLVAGTGINPMLSLILFLLERRIKPCERIILLAFHHREEDIILKKEIKDLEKKEARLKVEFIITSSDPGWTGLKGHINVNMIMNFIREGFKSNVLITKDIMYFVCGPLGFLDKTNSELTSLNIDTENITLFSTMEVTLTNKLNFATY